MRHSLARWYTIHNNSYIIHATTLCIQYISIMRIDDALSSLFGEELDCATSCCIIIVTTIPIWIFWQKLEITFCITLRDPKCAGIPKTWRVLWQIHYAEYAQKLRFSGPESWAKVIQRRSFVEMFCLKSEFMDTIRSALVDPSCRIAVNYLRTALIGFRSMSLIPINWKLCFKSLMGGNFSLLFCGWVKYVKMIFSHFVKAMHVHWRNNICHWIICVRFRSKSSRRLDKKYL